VSVAGAPRAVDRAGSTPAATASAGTAPAAPQIRLLKFLTLFGFGGTERQVVNLTRMLDRSRFEPRFACMKRWGHFLEDIEQQRIPISEYRISCLYKPGTFRQQLRLAADMKRQGIQIAHSYNFYANVFALPAARLAGVPVTIASIRDTGVGITPAKMRMHKLICRLADCVLVNAEAVRQWLIEQGYRADKITVIRNGIDLSRFAHPGGGAGLRRELGLPEQAPLVVVLARLIPQKGIESFLEAAAEVSRRYPDARFLIVGEVFVFRQDKSRGNGAGERDVAERDIAYHQVLARQVARLGLDGRVIFTGYRSDVPELLSQAAVSVLPSLSEGLSNTVLESMAAGVPVVATRVGGNPELIDDGVGGLLVPPRNPGELARAICAVLDDRDFARRLGQAAKRRVAERFSLERMVRETEDLYVTLLERATRGKRRAYRESGSV